MQRTSWPKRMLVKHATPEDVRERLTELGHAPEDFFGLAPDFQSRKTFFGLRKG